MTQGVQISHDASVSRHIVSRHIARLLAAGSNCRIGLLLAALASPAHAQAPAAPPAQPIGSEPQMTTATYADWIVRCQRATDAPQAPRQCEVAQTVQAQQVTILQMAFARTDPKQPYRLVIVVPDDISFPSTPRASINDKDPSPVDLSWRNCTRTGCAAETNISEEQLKRWRAQAERGRVQIKDAAGRDTTIPFSFRGLAEALDALAKS